MGDVLEELEVRLETIRTDLAEFKADNKMHTNSATLSMGEYHALSDFLCWLRGDDEGDDGPEDDAA